MKITTTKDGRVKVTGGGAENFKIKRRGTRVIMSPRGEKPKTELELLHEDAVAGKCRDKIWACTL